MWRRLHNASSGLSLLLCVALAVLWVRSYRVMDGVRYSHPSATSSHCLHTRHGAVHYLYCGPPLTTTPGWRWLGGPQPPKFVAMVDRPQWRALGFAGGGVKTFWFVSVPFWSLVIAAAALPAATLVRRVRRRRRLGAGRCAACGYDLTANVSGVCPECGAAR